MKNVCETKFRKCLALLAVVLAAGFVCAWFGVQNVYAAEKVTYETANTVEDATVSDNISDNYYAIWASVVNSYLIENEDGTFTRVEYISDTGVLVETYTADYTVKSSMVLTEDIEEMPLFGGFYEGEENYYLLYGHSNEDSDNSQEVLRLVKYDKSWNRVSDCKMYGMNTYCPFYGGSARMIETGGLLYIYTCHQMYPSDGVVHQANMTIAVDEEEMSVSRAYYVISVFQYGYVSHSFNQFIQTDGTYVYRVDHGDASPRAVSITRFTAGGSTTAVTYTYAYKIPGSYDAFNRTGVSVGGMELSADNILITGNAVNAEGSSTYSVTGQRNIFLTVTDKELGETNMIWLTDYSSDDDITPRTPQLVKISDDQFLILWEEETSTDIVTRAVNVDGDGNLLSDIFTVDVRLSDCQPVVNSDGLVTWYVTDGSETVIYVLDPDDLFASLKIELTAENTEDGVALSWTVSEGVSYYKVYRRTESGSYSLVATVTGSSWEDTGMDPGINYYQVVAVSASGAEIVSGELETVRLTAPVIQSVTNEMGGIQVVWEKVEGATGYRVYYRISSSSTGRYSYKTVSGGDTLTYTISMSSTNQSYDIYVTACTDSYMSTASDVVTIMYLKYPVVTPTLEESAVSLSWNTISEAEGYYVYRSTEDGEAVLIAETEETTYTDVNVTGGTTYTYQVCAYACGDCGALSKEKTVVFMEPPAITEVVGTSTGISVTWETVDGAEKYYFYSKLESADSFNRKIITAGSGDTQSYTWNATSGETYEFYVVAYASGYPSAALETVVFTYLQTPTVTVTMETADLLIAWDEIAGAEGYYVWKSTAGGAYELLTTTTSLSYADGAVESNVTYTYQVYAYMGDILSSGSAELSVTFLEPPVITGIENTSSSLMITWDTVEGADGYYVSYKSESADSYTTKNVSAGSESSQSYKLSGTAGAVYEFYVRAYVNGNSSAESNHVTLTYLKVPSLTLTTEKTDVLLSWSEVTGAEGYYVYRCAEDGTYVCIGTTTDLSYADATVESGVTYSYQIYAYAGTSVSAGSTEKSTLYLAAPTITGAVTSGGLVRVTWEAVDGAARYYIYYRNVTESTYGYEYVAADGNSTQSLSIYSSEGNTYEVYVKAYASGYFSDLSDTIEVTCLGKPVLTTTTEATGIVLSWTEVEGLDQYDAYRKTGDGDYTYLGTTTRTTWKDDGLESGTKYTYAVFAYADDTTGSWGYSSAVVFLSPPEITAVSNTSSGITLTWDSVTGASGYYVFYKLSSDSDYTKKYMSAVSGDTQSYTFSATAGETYEFYVQAYLNNGYAYYSADSDVKEYLRIARTYVTLTGEATDILLSWTEVTAAEGYYIYRCTNDGEYTLIGTTTELTWTDTTVESGNTYTYQVYAYAGDVIGAGSTEKSRLFIAAPVVLGASAADGQLFLTWETVPGAESYYVYIGKSTDTFLTSYTVEAEEGGSQSYSMECSTNGTTYKAFLKTYVDGSVSVMSESVTFMYLAASTVTLSQVSDGVSVSWTENSYAEGYYVYRKSAADAQYVLVTTTADVAWTDTDVIEDETYTYQVYAYNGISVGVASDEQSITLRGTDKVYLEDTDIYVIRTDSENGNIDASTVEELAAGRSTEQLIFSKTTSFDRTLELVLEEIEATLGVSVEGDKALLLQTDSNGNLILIDQAMIENDTVTFSVSTGADGVVVYGYNGDVTGDGKIDAKDTLAILRGVSGRTALDEVEKGFADVNLDGMINSNDLLAVVKYVSGRTSTLN